MNAVLPIEVDNEPLKAFCQKHHIIKLAFFGSVLTDRFGPASDVDVLVTFDPQHIPTLPDVCDMELELGEIFKRKVDLRTPNDLSKYFREEVVSSARVHYAA